MPLPHILLLALALLLVPCALRVAEARVKLNSIRTVILRDSYILPVNRSLWEPSLDFTMYPCMSDLECREGSYCHASPKGTAPSRCHSCRRRKRRCHRDGMCCPGNQCSNNVCVANADSSVSQRVPESDGSMSPLASKRSWRRRGRADMKGVAGKGQVGDPCLRSTDCSARLCCARHFWTRICKPVLQEGQVCTRHRRKGAHGLELFQRCPCGDALTCRTLRDDQTPSAEARPASTLLAAANSKLASSRHSSPHTSPLSSPEASSASAVAKTRLHVCQRE